MALLELHGIQKSFPGARVLNGVSFDLNAGETHALVGANGAGKSTLIKILSGAYTRDSGEILLDGRPVRIRNPQEAIQLGIGVIYQEFNLVPDLSVAENVLIGQEPVRKLGGVLPLLSRAAILAEGRAHLAEIGFPLDASRPVRELTTGEKQMVEIAKALHRKARVLVLDEPTAALSRAETEQLFRIMGGLRERGLGMIYISHHLDEVFRVADRITVLRDGTNVATWPRGEVTEKELVQAMVGKVIPAEEARAGAGGEGETLLEAERLSGDGFGEVSFRLGRGEILAVTGAAGAGQSELCWGVYGASPLRAGVLRLRGAPVRWRSPRDAVRAGVLLAPGDRKAYGIIPGLDVAANFTFSQMERWTTAGVLRAGARRREAGRMIAEYGVRCWGPEQEIQLLSGGNQQKVVVGRAAERRGDVYLFDEPTRGVDVGAREEIYALIRRLAAAGAGVIVATPDIHEAMRLGHRVAVMRQGRIVYLEQAEDASEPAILAAIIGAEEPAAARGAREETGLGN